MYSTYKYLLVIILLFMLGCKDNSVSSNLVPDIKFYFPLAKGNTWTYDWSHKYNSRDTVTIETLKTDSSTSIVAGIECYRLNSWMDISPFSGSSFGISNNKIFKINIRIGEMDTFFISPSFVGQEWNVRCDHPDSISSPNTIMPYYTNKRCIRSIEKVTVPAGTFSQCYSVLDSIWNGTIDFSTNTLTLYQRTICYEWYAPNVGLVKQSWLQEHYWQGMLVSSSTSSISLRTYNVKLSD